MLNREVAFLKNRTTSYIVFGLVGLAVFGLFSKVFNNPVGFFKGIAIIIGVVAVVFLLIKLIYKPSPAKREQQHLEKLQSNLQEENSKRTLNHKVGC